MTLGIREAKRRLKNIKYISRSVIDLKGDCSYDIKAFLPENYILKKNPYWYEKEKKIPTLDELEREQQKYIDLEYKEKREVEYPTQMELLEALLENMEGRPQKLNEVKEKRAQVRAKYPKNV